STRIPQAPDRYGFYVDAEEHELGDVNQPPNYKVALLDSESDKWVEVMNAEMQSMKDNQRFKMENSKSGNIPIQERPNLSKAQGVSILEEVKRMQRVPYASAIVSIMYAVKCTRPDDFSKILENVIRLLLKLFKYLRNTKDMVLVYGGNLGNELRVTCYTNVGFETDKDDTKSQS
ncbi:hypothetical protein Tco_1444996, partial [Tanacetum coccineum]